MQNIIVLKGLQGSGKSTWATNEVATNPNKYKRINKDELRAMLDASIWNQDNERFLLKLQEYIVMEALKAGKDVIIDDTNFDKKHFKRMCNIAVLSNRTITVSEKYFPVALEVAIERDSKRPKPVGEKVIRDYHNRYIKDQTITEQKFNSFARITPPIVYDPKLYDIIICDLDGTAALLNGRNPYDASTCDQDLPNKPVIQTLIAMIDSGYRITFVSGREDKYKEQTLTFLTAHFGDEFDLFMRKTGDQRADQIIKKEIYDEHIRNKFNVLYVIDDRPKVVRMWRHDLGLTVFQLNDIEF